MSPPGGHPADAQKNSLALEKLLDFRALNTHCISDKARERHERWRSRLDRMHEECLEERKAARADVSRLEDRAEEVEALARTVAREAEEEQAALRVSLTVEFNQAGWVGTRVGPKC